MIGAPIFRRHARGVSLTEGGNIMADQAVRTLRELDLSQERVAQAIQGLGGRVRMGSVTGPSLELILPLVREVRVSTPAVELAVQVDTSDKLAEALLARELDFYVGAHTGRRERAALCHSSRSATSRSAWWCAPIIPLQRIENVTLKQCLEYDWVFQPPGGLLRRDGGGLSAVARAATAAPGHGHGLDPLHPLALIQKSNAIAPLARAVRNSSWTAAG